MTKQQINQTQRIFTKKIGSRTVTGTGSISITGLGFKPKMITFYSWSDNAATSSQNVMTSVSVVDESLNVIGVSTVNRNGHGGKPTHLSTSCIVLQSMASGGASANNNLIGTVTSLDADGFTVNITTYAASGTIGFDWVAEA